MKLNNPVLLKPTSVCHLILRFLIEFLKRLLNVLLNESFVEFKNEEFESQNFHSIQL